MNSVHNCDYILKFLIIGNAGCGKTCILRRFTEKKFVGDTPHTIGAEFGSKIIDVDGTSIKIQIWDTAGQERFRSMARSYYHDAVGALLVYDITNRDSFTALHRWLTDARQFASPEIVTILVGNKIDKQETEENVTRWEANAFAQDNELQFIETSALTGENIEESFLQCTRSILSKIKNGELSRESLRCGKQQNTVRIAETTNNPTPSSDPYYNYSLSNECYC